MKTIKRNDSNKFLTACVYGGPGSGKTRFLATWPSPVIYAGAEEGGYCTVQHMPTEDYYDGTFPLIRAVNGKDWSKIPSDAAKEVANGRKTIGIDPISFLMDDYLSELTKSNRKLEGFQLWGRLLHDSKELLKALHSLPAHVVWVCSLDEDGGIALPGNFKHKLPHMCSLLLYARVDPDSGYQIRTRKFHSHNARTRFADAIPDPLGVWVDDPENPGYLIGEANPTYKSIETCLELQGPKK